MNARYLCFTVCLLAVASPAAAQDSCFNVTGERGSRTQHLVAIDDVVQLSERCEYGIAAGGPYFGPGDLAGRETDFLEVWARLEAQPNAYASGDPRVVYARETRRGAADTQHTLMLRYCAHYLLEEQLGFRVVPEAADGGIRIERVQAAGCDAGRVELRAVTGANRARLWSREAEQTMGTTQRALELPEGDWSIYAARPGSPAGLRIGVFRSQRVVTPLQNHLHVVGLRGSSSEPPLLAANWAVDGPGLLLYPTEAALSRELLWPELRTASDARVLWVAGRQGVETPIVLGNVQLEGGENPGVRLPDSVIRAYMASTYGDAGQSMVPNNEDWRRVFDGLAICLAPSYHDARPVERGRPVPSANACASLSGLAVLAQAEAAQPSADAQMCLRHGMQVIHSSGGRQEPFSDADCFPLPAPGSRDSAPEHFAVAGDRITLSGSQLCAIVDGRPLEAEEGTNEIVLPAGLLEIRQGGGTGCSGRQALARYRMPVIDPYTEWHPVGLYTGGEGEQPWQRITHDETDYFAFVDARHELEFRLSTSEPVAAAINARGSTQLTQDVPLLAGTTGEFGGARGPAIVAYVSRSDECPANRPVSELAAESPVDPDDVLVDATFHVYLLGVAGMDANATCLARASFRVHPSRALFTYTVESEAFPAGFELGLLGDTQVAFWWLPSEDFTVLGLMLPVAWARFTPAIRFVAIEASANLTAGAAFAPEHLGLIGGGVSAQLVFGVPEYLPRIFSAGVMLNFSFDTIPAAIQSAGRVHNVVDYSLFLSVNLATLIDLAGGR